MKTRWLILELCLLSLGAIRAQKTIELTNPSFEKDLPGAGIVPAGWIDLGAADQTPPDIQPGSFGVSIPAQEGNNYLGLAVRGNNTWEGVGQRLKAPLQMDSIYRFSLWLTRSNTYRSPTPDHPEFLNFNAPTILKIWGFNTKTKQEELLAVSQPVSHSKWVQYEFTLRPKIADFDEIDLMSYYAPGHEMEYGNLLLDHCSAIIQVQK